MLIDWLSSLRDDQASIGVNDVVLFGIMDPARPSRQSRTQGGRLLTSLLVETDAPIPWVDGGTLEERQRAFELAVQRVREKGHRLPGMVARTLALSQEVVLQTADAVDDVAATVAELPTKPGTVLALVSDEIARARLLECSTFTGKNTAAELGICAGYTLSESEAMQCLVGKSCQPRLDLKSRSTAYAAALTIAGRYGIKELATSNLLPRNMVEGVSLENLQIEAGKCLDSARVNDDDTMNCLTRFFGKGDAGRYAKCLDTGRTSKEPITQVLRCIHGEVPQGALGLASCLENTRNKKGASADCLLQSIAPPALAQAMECSKQHHEPKAIARCALGDRDPKVAQLAECIDDARDGTWTHCASSLLGDAIPAEVAEFTKCVTPGSEYADVALCAAGDRLPKHARKGAQCLAQNGGDLIGSGICMAADSLNPYQQVALQCAATSSGEPTAFATCAGGRLLVMRVQGCLKDDFGSGACFGPNNDFQKAIKGIFGKEIKPNSPIGTVIGAHVEVIRTTVALAGDLADELEKLDDRFEKLGEKAKEFGRAFERGLAKAGRDFDRERRKVTRKVVGRDFDDWRRNPKKKARQLVKGVF
jgi:hypothetical protein